MGPGAWIIMAIVLIQVVAGALAKAAEGRKAKERRDASLSKGTSGKPGSLASKVSEKVISRTEALEQLRRQRIEELRKRIVGASEAKSGGQGSTRVKVDAGGAAPGVPPVAAPPVAERPAQRLPDQAKSSRQPAQRKVAAEKAARSKSASSGRSRRAGDRSAQPRTRPASKQKPAVVAKADASKSSVSEDAFARKKSPIFNSAIALSAPGQEKVSPAVVQAGSAGVMQGMLQDPEKFRQAVLLSELLAPPVSLRPGGCGGVEQTQS